MPAGLSERIALATYARPTFAQRVAALLQPAPARVAVSALAMAGVAAVIVLRPNGNDGQPLSSSRCLLLRWRRNRRRRAVARRVPPLFRRNRPHRRPEQPEMVPETMRWDRAGRPL
jgi:hypothetical protein